jgi:hypothetical protein
LVLQKNKNRNQNFDLALRLANKRPARNRCPGSSPAADGCNKISALMMRLDVTTLNIPELDGI